ncbi:MAG: hypothetical protein PF445_12465 [Melioribacteraceae bacterium]|nr:hypothetical protein [Melioribacteraceae bacterium]
MNKKKKSKPLAALVSIDKDGKLKAGESFNIVELEKAKELITNY